MSEKQQSVTVAENHASTDSGTGTTRRNPIEERLHAVTNALDYIEENEEVRISLSNHGIYQEALSAGRRLVGEAAALAVWQKTLYGRQFGAARDVEHLQARVHRAYHPVFRLACFLFGEDPVISRRLMLRGKRSDSLTGWIRQVSAFFGSALTDERLMSVLADYGCSESDLSHGNQLLHELTRAVMKQEKQKTACEAATRRRNVALRRAYDWRDALHEKARELFSDTPEVLRNLNVPEKDDL